RIALPCAAPHGGERLARLLLGHLREQPQGEVLQAHRRRPKTAGRRGRGVESRRRRHGRRTRVELIVRALIAQLRAVAGNIRASLFQRDARDAALDDELQGYVDELADRYEREGLSRQDARRAALLATGGVTQVKEATRDAWLDRHLRSI